MVQTVGSDQVVAHGAAGQRWEDDEAVASQSFQITPSSVMPTRPVVCAFWWRSCPWRRGSSWRRPSRTTTRRSLRTSSPKRSGLSVLGGKRPVPVDQLPRVVSSGAAQLGEGERAAGGSKRHSGDGDRCGEAVSLLRSVSFPSPFRSLERLRENDLIHSLKDYYRASIEALPLYEQEVRLPPCPPLTEQFQEIRQFFRRMNESFAGCYNPIRGKYEFN